MTQAWFGRGEVKFRLSRSPARTPPVLAGTVVLALRPRTSPFMPSSRMRRSTVCLETSGKPWRASQAVILRRP